jgi:hypothetical protein
VPQSAVLKPRESDLKGDELAQVQPGSAASTVARLPAARAV